jgi:lipopolysaccharide biosynthesis glycosyltransferase
MQLATTLRSITDAHRHVSERRFDICVLVEDFPLDIQEKIERSLTTSFASIRWFPVRLEKFNGFSLTSHISSRIAYARLLIPALFQPNVRRVIYLDADVLVLSDLLPLFTVDMDGAPVAAVCDLLDGELSRGNTAVGSLPKVAAYFNSGVLLIDLPRWREEKISERAYAYLARHPQSPFGDQDALNVACDGNWTRLDQRWNFQDHFQTRIIDLPPSQRPAIVHFVTGQKPWLPKSLSVNSELYDAFRSRTPFARTHRDQVIDMVLWDWRRVKRRLRARLDVGLPLLRRPNG